MPITMSFSQYSAKKPLATVESTSDRSAKRGPKLHRPRAKKACGYCRCRKTRCDWASTGNPCTNCRLDSRDCVTIPRKQQVSRPRKQRGERRRKTKQLEASTGSIFPTPSPSESFRHGQLSPPSGVQMDTTPEWTEKDQPGQFWESGWPSDEHRESCTNIMQWESEGNGWRPPAAPTNAVDAAPPHVFETLPFPLALPSYIHPLPTTLSPEDRAYLKTKRVLDVPERTLRNALLRSYVDYVHPFLPIINIEEFLQAIQTGGSNGLISLLLFQAVMFAATPFVDDSVLAKAGVYRGELRRAYFENARVLYQLDSESDRVVIVQALLLLTFWSETPREVKDCWHWMSICTTIARSAGLHQNPDTLQVDGKTVGLRKRIWWSCYMRDRLIALSMRRPLLIQDEDCSVPPLHLEDFETDALTLGALRLLGAYSSAAKASRRIQLATMCMEKAKLCICISKILSTQYSVQAQQVDGNMPNAMVTLVPKKSASSISDAMECAQELNFWWKKLPDEARYKPKYVNVTRRQGVVKVHLAVLGMTYLATSSALYRPHVVPSAPGQDSSSLIALSRRKIRDAACEIAKAARDLMDLDLAVYFPATAVTALLPAAFNHLFQRKSTENSCCRMGSWHYFQCVQALQKMADRHAVADHAVTFLDSVTRATKLPQAGSLSLRRRYSTDTRPSSASLSSSTSSYPDLSSPGESPFHHAIDTGPPLSLRQDKPKVPNPMLPQWQSFAGSKTLSSSDGGEWNFGYNDDPDESSFGASAYVEANNTFNPVLEMLSPSMDEVTNVDYFTQTS